MGVDSIAATCLVPYVDTTAAATFVRVFPLRCVVVRRSSDDGVVRGDRLFEKAGLRWFRGEAMDVAVRLVKESSRGGHS